MFCRIVPVNNSVAAPIVCTRGTYGSSTNCAVRTLHDNLELRQTPTASQPSAHVVQHLFACGGIDRQFQNVVFRFSQNDEGPDTNTVCVALGDISTRFVLLMPTNASCSENGNCRLNRTPET